MAATMVGRTPELGYHVVSMDGTPPPAPVTPEPPVEPPPEAPPDDAAGQPASPDAAPGDPPAAPDEEEVALSETQPRATRPFVARTLRENQSLRDQVARQEAQLAYLTEQLQRSAAPRQDQRPVPPSPPQSTLRPPRAEEYGEDTAAFSQALEQYWRGMSREETLAALRERDEQLVQQQVAALHEHVNRRVVEGRRKYEDFDEAIASLNATLQGSELFGVLKQHVAQSPHGVELLRHVGLHPEVLQELTYRTPMGAVQYLSALEAQFGQTPPQPPQRPRSPATNGAGAPSLPPAVRPLTGGGGVARPQGSTPAEIANGTGNFVEYVRAMRQQEHQRGIRR